ncbi:MAG: RNase adapter RapZ [Microbacteriaceae bacterium]
MNHKTTEQQRLLIVTGMSGAGRSTVGNALEDMGWYVVDNLPPQMLRPLIDLSSVSEGRIPKIAAVVDVRGSSFFADLQEILQSVRAGVDLRILFLDATDGTLVRRFESVRRPHPLQGDGTILDGIEAERARMNEMRENSDIVLDTSEFNVHQLSTAVHELFAEASTAGIRVTLQSFGFKYGTPTDADMIADARFLPNPFWEADLQSLTGKDEEVAAYVLNAEGSREFIDAYARALEPVLSGYLRENKRRALIAVGCTGGKHRSVAIVEQLARALSDLPNVTVNVRHRDLGRE